MRPLRTPAPAGGSRILGVGAYRPARVVGNEEICARIDSSDAWITRRSGITGRRFADPGETVVTMAAEASRKALAQAGLTPAAVDTVIVASMSYRGRSPAAAPEVAHLLDAAGAGAMDIHAACAGFCYALGVADALVRARSGYVVVVGAERMSDVLDLDDRGTAFLFGDGAGAVVMGPSAEPGIGPVVWTAEGALADLITYEQPRPRAPVPAAPDCAAPDCAAPDSAVPDSAVPDSAVPDSAAPGPVLRMAGQRVFRWAIRTVPQTARQAVEAAGIEVSDLVAFVPHQANLRIIEAVAGALRLPPHVVVAKDVVAAGNTSAASVPLALDHLITMGSVPRGGHVLLAGFGAGGVRAAQVVTLP
jgi:3-oxoacyl-[acyl-carrier-protein] synthase III